MSSFRYGIILISLFFISCQGEEEPIESSGINLSNNEFMDDFDIAYPPIKLEVENASFEATEDHYYHTDFNWYSQIQARITNVSDEVILIQSWTCSYTDQYGTNSDLIQIHQNICYANVPTCITIEPDSSIVQLLIVGGDEEADLNNFQLYFQYTLCDEDWEPKDFKFNDNYEYLIWSDSVTLEKWGYTNHSYD